MLMQNNLVWAAPVAICNKSSDRDTVALHTGRILQSCAVVENSIFKMISSRKDVPEFNTIQRTKRPAFRNVMSDVRKVVEASIAARSSVFKNPKRLLLALIEFDKIASFRSDLAHAEFITSGEIDEIKIAILSNESIEGATFQDRKVQLVQITDVIAMDHSAHRLANTLRQILANQISHIPKA
jgi:hypothetical protein